MNDPVAEHKPEYLESVFDGRATHAIYPTALRTLCLKEPKPAWVRSESKPSCYVCLHTIVTPAFRGSAPRVWGKMLGHVFEDEPS